MASPSGRPSPDLRFRSNASRSGGAMSCSPCPGSSMDGALVIVFRHTGRSRRLWDYWRLCTIRLVSKAVKAAFDQAVTGLGFGDPDAWSDSSIRQIPGILGSVSLTKLSAPSYAAAEFAAEASRLTGLTSLAFSSPGLGRGAFIGHLRTIRGSASQLRQLSISNVRVGSLDSLGALTSLTSLTVVSCDLQADALAGLGGSSSLKELDIHDNAGLSSLVGLGGALVKLDASDCDLWAGSLAGLAGCTQLQELHLRRNSMGSLVGLGGLGQLKKLDVAECRLGRGALGILSGCSNLEWVSALANEHIGSLAGLGGSLVSLHAGGCGLVGVAELGGCSNLEYLNVWGNSSLVSLVGLGRCTALKFLEVRDCDLEPRALTALADCSNLEQINFIRCGGNPRLNERDEYEDLEALADLGWLRALKKY